MSWSKVKKPFSKPIGWWWHKFFCELSYTRYEKYGDSDAMNTYYFHLNRMIKVYGFNLYGEKV